MGIKLINDQTRLKRVGTVVVEPGTVFFLHMVVMKSAAERAMAVGQPVLVTEAGCERLSRLPLDLIVNNG